MYCRLAFKGYFPIHCHKIHFTRTQVRQIAVRARLLALPKNMWRQASFVTSFVSFFSSPLHTFLIFLNPKRLMTFTEISSWVKRFLLLLPLLFVFLMAKVFSLRSRRGSKSKPTTFDDRLVAVQRNKVQQFFHVEYVIVSVKGTHALVVSNPT